MADRVLISGGTVIDPANDIDERRDVLIENGIIRAVVAPESARQAAKGATVVDAAGCWVTPGLIDMHVHLREPGYEYRETIASGTEAAVAGGFTAVACMANTKPVNDNAAVTEYILDRARVARKAHVFPIGAVSVNLEGKQLAEVGEMRRAGIVAISDDGNPISDSALMRRALEYARLFDMTVIAHEEDCALAQGGVMNEGPTSVRLGLRGVPAAAEETMVARDVSLAELSGGKLHLAHLSTAGAVALVRDARRRGLAVSAEATPHHLFLTEDAVEGYNTNAKMNPPLRGEGDVEALRQGLRDGTVEVIASDHAPHHADEKEVEFDLANFGVIGLETALPLALRLIGEADIPRQRLVRALTAGPARILGVERGTLTPGAVADVTVIDPQAEWVYRAAEGHSKSRNSPFDGWPMKGRARYTIVAGRIVWETGCVATRRE
jgi:dihydroorotase